MHKIQHPSNKDRPSSLKFKLVEKYFATLKLAIERLMPAIVKPMTREAITAILSAFLSKLDTHKPLIPSVMIMPAIKAKHTTIENGQPAICVAAIENKVAWLMVSKDNANSASTQAISAG